MEYDAGEDAVDAVEVGKGDIEGGEGGRRVDGQAAGCALLDVVAQAGSGGGTTVVRGEDIYLSLTNYMRRTGKKF